METIKEKAKAYEPKKTRSIAELDSVQVDLNTREEKFNEGKDDEFTITVIDTDGKEYRIPDSVLKSLKVILKEKPDLKTFKVVKTGEGLNTNYTVVPIE